MKSKFKKGDLVFLPRLSPAERDVRAMHGIVFHKSRLNGDAGDYGFIIDFPIDGKSWARLCLSDGTKTTVLTKDLEKANESTD